MQQTRTKATHVSRSTYHSRVIPKARCALVPNTSATRVPILASVQAVNAAHIVTLPLPTRLEPSGSSITTPTDGNIRPAVTVRRSTVAVPSMRSLGNSSSVPSVCPLIADRPTPINEPLSSQSQLPSNGPSIGESSSTSPALTRAGDISHKEAVNPLPRPTPASVKRSAETPVPSRVSPVKPNALPRKKDPLAGLFLPKSRALSQRPASIPTRAR
jgi:hypothetical protein